MITTHIFAPDEKPIAKALEEILKNSARYDDLILLLKELLRQKDMAVLKSDKGWAIIHQAMSDNHPSPGIRIAETEHYLTMFDAYRSALMQAMGLIGD